MQRWHVLMVPALLVSATFVAYAQEHPAIKIGVFDPEEVWRSTEVGKKFNQDLSESRDRLQANIDKKQQEIEGLVEKLRQQQASLSDDKAQQMQKEIQTRRVELNRLNEDATADMKQQLNDIQGRFQQMLMETLATFGKEKSFTLILNKAVVDFNSQQVDVTQDLIAKFNEVNKAPIGPAPKTQEKKAPAAKPPDKKAPEKPKEPPKDSSKP